MHSLIIYLKKAIIDYWLQPSFINRVVLRIDTRTHPLYASTHHRIPNELPASELHWLPALRQEIARVIVGQTALWIV